MGTATGFLRAAKCIYSDVGTACASAWDRTATSPAGRCRLPGSGPVHAVAPYPLFLDLRMLATNDIMNYPVHFAAHRYFCACFVFVVHFPHFIIVLSRRRNMVYRTGNMSIKVLP